MFQQPIVQDMAMQYGQKLADQGKQIMENQFEKWVPVAKLKYYFAVDNAYVGRKLRLLFFPYMHKVRVVKHKRRNHINYILLSGLVPALRPRAPSATTI